MLKTKTANLLNPTSKHVYECMAWLHVCYTPAT